MNIDPISWTKLALSGYLLTIAFETPVLLALLGNIYSFKEKLRAGILLTAFSYPFVAVIFPLFFNPYSNYGLYLLVSEIFAPLSECLLFAWLFQSGKSESKKERFKAYAVILAANLFSFLSGELLKGLGMRLV